MLMTTIMTLYTIYSVSVYNDKMMMILMMIQWWWCNILIHNAYHSDAMPDDILQWYCTIYDTNTIDMIFW